MEGSERRLATPKDVEEAWGTRDIANHFGVPIATVVRAIQRGSIPGCVKVLGRYVCDKEEALKWQPAALTITATELAEGPKGAFKKGNAFGVGTRGGRPSRKVELKWLSTLSKTVAVEDWAEIIKKAVEQAKAGDRHARQWLSNYLMGTPIQRVKAEVDVSSDAGFADGERMAAILSLFNRVQERVDEEAEEKIVDAELTDAAL